jgi:hypothetical protein
MPRTIKEALVLRYRVPGGSWVDVAAVRPAPWVPWCLVLGNWCLVYYTSFMYTVLAGSLEFSAVPTGFMYVIPPVHLFCVHKTAGSRTSPGTGTGSYTNVMGQYSGTL